MANAMEGSTTRRRHTSGARPRAKKGKVRAETVDRKSDKLVSALDNYLRDLTVLHTIGPGIFRYFVDDLTKVSESIEEYSHKYGKKVGRGKKQRIFYKSHHVSKAVQLNKEFSDLAGGIRLFPQILLLALVSRYDAFVHGLIRGMFNLKPDMLASLESQQLSLGEVLAFSSIEDAKDYAIEKEAEDVLRASHAKQFEWFEKRLGVSLKKGLDIWPQFIEATERRNLITHTDGRVSRQYLQVCQSHGVSLPPDTKSGDQLKVDAAYYRDVRRVFFEIGVKLAHVIWRKLCPEERDHADSHLNYICLELLKSKQFALAGKLLKFACDELPQHSSDEMKRILTINYANARNLAGKRDECIGILDKVDWSASANKFQLGVAVLKEDYKKAARLMRAIGKSEEVTAFDYSDWPLFEKFRESPEFLAAYEDIFGEPFSVPGQLPPPTEVVATAVPQTVKSSTR